jgi:N-acetyl-gamma-glutamyl-phosphate reductase
MKENIKVSVIGASGYTGAELIRLLKNHENIEIKSLIASSNAGKSIGEIYNHLAWADLPDLISLEEESFKDIKVAFLCLPHGTTQEVAKKIPSHVRIIDLSADFRITNLESYKKWYGQKHIARDLQAKAVYGLAEINREQIINANLVACPGCYPTSILLPILPLVEAWAINKHNIISDSKSGISGAGRKAVQPNLFTEVNENVRPYSLGGHRHVAEIEQEISKIAGGKEILINFTPQVVPMNRGIISTIYVEHQDGKTTADLKEILQNKYQNENFVKVAKGDEIPTPRDVYSTNMCYMNIFKDRLENRSIIVSCIDNLVKGASGQAVQNFNIMFGFDETTGLKLTPVFP